MVSNTTCFPASDSGLWKLSHTNSTLGCFQWFKLPEFKLPVQDIREWRALRIIKLATFKILVGTWAGRTSRKPGCSPCYNLFWKHQTLSSPTANDLHMNWVSCCMQILKINSSCQNKGNLSSYTKWDQSGSASNTYLPFILERKDYDRRALFSFFPLHNIWMNWNPRSWVRIKKIHIIICVIILLTINCLFYSYCFMF